MTTEQKLLQAEGEELMRVLGEVLQPEKNQHILGYGNLEANCRKCNKLLKTSGAVGFGRTSKWHWVEGVDRICTVIDPIQLTPDNQVKWRDWAVEKFGEKVYVVAMTYVYWELEYAGSDLKVTGNSWNITKAQPEHYLKAAALCVIKAEKEQK